MTASEDASPLAAAAAASAPQKKTSVARPTTLDLTRSYEQSARNQNELNDVETSRKISRLSIFVNRCSHQDEDVVAKQNQLIASTLVSPDTPRAKRKYQQLFINGNAYTNLGLKVTTRPTYCCIYRLQPMFVTQEANPQLSMYSQWKTVSVPSGDILEQVGSPHALMSAYNSTEAVYEVSRSRLPLFEIATAATMGGFELDEEEALEGGEPRPVEIVKPTGTITREFLDRVVSRLTNYMSTNPPVRPDPDADKSVSPFPARSYERTLFAAFISQGEGYSCRLTDTCARSQFILTHSSHHQLSSQARIQQQRLRKRSRTHAVDFYKSGVKPSEMVIASSAASSTYLSQSEQASRLPITEASSSIKLPEMSLPKPRKRSSTSTSMSATSLSTSAFSPFLTMHPMLGHLPAKSKQTVMYIMMMSQAPMSMSVPTVASLASSKNLASRKFSECIGVKPNALEENWAARIGVDGSTEIVPKRIKIFEGGFKSNEDYTYVRGRGRGKYVCEECGIRCKKPSMLKKHIRTHTDLRPYSCRHCAFAFKTKGNLTKHMKSKAHHKKCVELGIIPVPTAIDDSQIDNDALAKQEQYELSCGSTGGFNQFADDEDDCDEDYDEEECEDEDEEDDEGVPIPLIEQQRLTYIVPGQFDDADGNSESTHEANNTATTNRGRKISLNHKNSDSSSTLSAASFSPRQKLSISSLSGGSSAASLCTTTSTVSSLSLASSTLPLSITDIRPAVLAEENDKCSNHGSSNNHRKISSSNSFSSALSPSGLLSVAGNSNNNGNKMMISSGNLQQSSATNKTSDMMIASQPHHRHHSQPQTCALQSYHFGQAASAATAISTTDPNKDRHLLGGHHSANSIISASSSSPLQQNSITKEYEAEAVQSLLILSGVSNSELGSANSSSISSIAKSSTATSLTSDSENALLQSMYRSSIAKKNSNVLVDFHPSGNQSSASSSERVDKTATAASAAIGNSEASQRADRIISYEAASDHVLLASQNQQQFMMDSRQSPIEMMRRISANSGMVIPGALGPNAVNQKPVDRRTSQPTSVIISRASPTESFEEHEERRKRSRHERSISESSTNSAHSLFLPMTDCTSGHPGLALSPKSHHMLSISSLITAPTPTFVNTNPTMSSASVAGFMSPTSAAAMAVQQQLLQQHYTNMGIRNPRAAIVAEEIRLQLQQQQQPRIVGTHSPQGSAIRESLPPSTMNGAPSHLSPLDANNILAQQKMMTKIYESLKQQQQQQQQQASTAAVAASLKTFPTNALYQGMPYVLSSSEPNKNLVGLSSPIAIATANAGVNQPKVPILTTQPSIPPNMNQYLTANGLLKEPTRKSPLPFQERTSSPQQTAGVSRHFGSPTSASQQYFSVSPNVPLPPAPSSTLPAPVTFDPARATASVQSASSDELDQPIDLSKTSSLSVPEVTVQLAPLNTSPRLEIPSHHSPLKAASVSNLSPNNALLQDQRQPSPISPSQQVAATIAAAAQQQQPSPNRPRFRPMIEEKHLTEQLVRAFSPFAEMHPLSYSSKSPNSHGREMYKNVRSEEFAHLSAGVHTPNRLPQNMLWLGARSNSNNSSSNATVTTSTAGSSSSTGSSTSSALHSPGPVARTPNSIPNAYTNAEGKSVCTICMKQFSKPSQLRLHINIHFFERPFRCDSCAVSFRTKGHLQKHSRSVSHLNKLNMNITFGRPSTDNPRPFKCSDCKIAFRIHGHLAKHLRSKMHIMKLECLGKLPFGMFAEMERSNINLTPIDTTDCEKALESLRSLAQKLYDPRQMCWKAPDPSAMDDVIEEDMDDEIDGEEDGYPDDDVDMSSDSIGVPLTASSDDSHEDNSGGSGVSVATARDLPAPSNPSDAMISTEQSNHSNNSNTSTSPPPLAGSTSDAIASTRSNTCHICNRILPSAKKLQTHLYSEHPDASDPEASSL